MSRRPMSGTAFQRRSRMSPGGRMWGESPVSTTGVAGAGGRKTCAWETPDLNYSLAPNDDSSTSRISLPFSFFGYRNCWVNNNGSIGFEFSSGDYTPWHADIPERLGPSVFAYWADEDTRDDPTNEAYVRYGYDDTIFIAEWWETGYYRMQYDKRASFQIILTPDNSFTFNYLKVEYDLGDASGLGDAYAENRWPALAGYYLPPMNPSLYFLHDCGYWNSRRVVGRLTDSGATPLISGSLNSECLGRYVFYPGGV